MFHSISSVFDQLEGILPGVFTTANTTTGNVTATGGISGCSTGFYTHPTASPTVSYYTLDTVGNYFKSQGQNAELDVISRAKDIYKSLPAFPAANVAMAKASGKLYVEIALPGYDLEDIDISFENDQLIVSVKKDNALSKRMKEREESILFHRGLKGSAIEFPLSVPTAKFDVKNATAKYEQGILTIEIPRTEESTPVRLKLK